MLYATEEDNLGVKQWQKINCLVFATMNIETALTILLPITHSNGALGTTYTIYF